MIDPVPPSALPTLTPVTTPPPTMPIAWSATVLLHPFAPPTKAVPAADMLFYQMGVATLDCLPGVWFSVRVAGCDGVNWWYRITRAGTDLSLDNGKTWTDIDMGWSLPGDWYGTQAANANSPGASPLNWMSDRLAAWWKIPVPAADAGDAPAYATWMWFDAHSGAPLRMMFGNGPPSPTKGDPAQLAFLQMFSLTYFASFQAFGSALEMPTEWQDPVIEGLAVGNPQNFKLFEWNHNFGVTSLDTPVNEAYNPLQTRMLFVWKSDAEYKVYTDRAQSTLMHYTYNNHQPAGQKPTEVAESLLTGASPAKMPAVPLAGQGFLYSKYRDGSEDCLSGDNFPFGQEPPDWLSIPAVRATIEATISYNPVLGPGQVVTVWSVMFPPARNYPQGTYLWAWYSPFPGSDGRRSRPIAFMQSESSISQGTSLALADYFFYKEFDQPIDAANFTVPPVCLIPAPR